jgi:hypothetical protein
MTNSERYSFWGECHGSWCVAQRYWEPPIIFLIGPGSWPGWLGMLSVLLFIAVRRDVGWRRYVFSAFWPIITQVVMLSVIGSQYYATKSGIAITIILFTLLLSFYLIYLGALRSIRPVARIVVACCQAYFTLWACFLALGIESNDWL